jgi:putative hydrolase of HD superfamily
MKKRTIKKHNPKEDIEKITNFILEYRTLKHLPRGCLSYLKGPVSENIAEHSFYTTIIGWLLAKLEGGNEDKIIKMCLIHDLAEVRGGEKNLINKFYTTPIDEVKIIKEVSRDYNIENFFLVNLLQEFSEEKTLEAKIAKDADVLAQMLLEKESFDLGNFRAKRWLSTSLKRLKTKNGKELGKVLYEIDSDKWWLEIVKKYILKVKFLSTDDPFYHIPHRA